MKRILLIVIMIVVTFALSSPSGAGVIHNVVKVTNTCNTFVNVDVYRVAGNSGAFCQLTLSPGGTQTCDLGIHCIGYISGLYYIKLADGRNEKIIMPGKEYFACHDVDIKVTQAGENTCLFQW